MKKKKNLSRKIPKNCTCIQTRP